MTVGRGRPGALTVGLLALPVLCCGLPLLAGGALAAVGGWLSAHGGWLAGGLALAAAAALGVRHLVSRRRCQPNPGTLPAERR